MTKKAINLYLHVHQPWRVKEYSVFSTSYDHQYFNCFGEDKKNNRLILEKVASKSYRPMNALLLKLLNNHPDFKFSLSITGTFIEQAKEFAPDVIEDFKKLVDTGRVEIVAETYYHSLAFFNNLHEFENQVEMHKSLIKETFGVDMRSFRNTELSYNDELGKWADKKGYDAIITEGWDKFLQWRSPNKVYRPPESNRIKLLLKNYQLSDDLAFRFSEKNWPEWPLTSEKYVEWIKQSIINDKILNLFMDYETFGEHQWEDTGIFNFFEKFVHLWLDNQDHTFNTISESAQNNESEAELYIPDVVTWADTERDLSAWTGNSMQQEALRCLYDLGKDVLQSKDQQLIADWRNLQTSDHVYYMCTKWFKDGDVHAYFSPYDSPYDAFLYFMNAIRDIRFRLHHSYKAGVLND